MTGQQHGKQFEDLIKALLFTGAADTARSVTSKIDIEAKFDRQLGLGTSIKASKGCRSVALADARSFWSMKGPFRLLVACYEQKGDQKIVYALHEFIIHGPMMSALRGGVTAAQVKAFHEGLGLAQFPAGQHDAARRWARQRLTELRPLLGRVTLNPKIDSKNQRRLQCSITMRRLTELATASPPFAPNTPNHTPHTTRLRNLLLPQAIHSPATRGKVT